MKCGVLRNSKSRRNRIFYDRLTVELAVELIAGGELDADLMLFSYRGIGKCAMYAPARVGEILTAQEIAECRKTIEEMREKPAPESIAGLKRMFLDYFSGITDCHLTALNTLDLGRLLRLGEKTGDRRRRTC